MYKVHSNVIYKVNMTEQPKYTIIKKDGPIEIRQYPALINAEVDVKEATYRGAINIGFRMLAEYIFGGNVKAEEIAMTSPVQVTESENIAMTKPVTISVNDVYTVAFIMPSKYTMETLPAPRNPAIRLVPQEAKTVVAIRFSGFYQKNQVDKAEQRLRDWLEKEGLQTKGEFIAAGYNPPWVPGIFSRNEVMVQVRMDAE
jgi:hypothetical protein